MFDETFEVFFWSIKWQGLSISKVVSLFSFDSNILGS